jgi:hypothetical protein
MGKLTLKRGVRRTPFPELTFDVAIHRQFELAAMNLQRDWGNRLFTSREPAVGWCGWRTRLEMVARDSVLYHRPMFPHIRTTAAMAIAIMAIALSASQTPKSPPAASKEQATLSEKEISIPNADGNIPGTLCLPYDASPGHKVPVVVMVQGSGPHDRDETIGPNKPFADIAHGLAARGIGTVRFDKRTWLIRQGKMPKPAGNETITLKWEIEDDAVAALEFARKLPEADPHGIFLLGHSLGAMTAPYIAKLAPMESKPSGLILMAAAARPHYAYVDDQIRTLLKSQGKTEAQIAVTLEQQHQIIAAVESGKLPPDQMLQGAPVHYMQEMIALDPTGELKRERIPALILQGGKDVQVFQADFELLKQAQDSRKVSGDDAKFFPDLNHLFMTVQGESSVASYQTSGQVAPEVIQTIADWLNARSK